MADYGTGRDAAYALRLQSALEEFASQYELNLEAHRKRRTIFLFPGGLGSYAREKGSLAFELGPTTDITLQWATYYDAADQAGQSRLYGGIHVQADDFTGRRIGSQCGKEAWLLAQRYYGGQGPA